MSKKQKTLYVSDLDGTLLNSESQVSECSVNIINDLVERGAMITVATARTPATVVPLLAKTKINLPYIVMAGAAMWDNVAGRYSYTCPIPAADVTRVCNIFNEYGLNPMVYRSQGNCLCVHHYGALSNSEKEFVAQRLGSPLKHFILDDKRYSQTDNDALLIFSMQEYTKLEPIFERVKAETECSPVFYHDIFNPNIGLMETYAAGSSKARAVKLLAEQVGAERIVVFGDNMNDIPMLEIADVSVAVDNAVDDVKLVANVIIGANNDDAVARWIAEDMQ